MPVPLWISLDSIEGGKHDANGAFDRRAVFKGDAASVFVRSEYFGYRCKCER